MYKYKRGINNIETARAIEYVQSDNLNTCLSLTGTLEARKPYNGMYIKNGKVMLSNLIEKIEINDKVYKMVELATTVKTVSCDDYIMSIDLQTNTFEYDLGPICYKKRIAFEERTERLLIEYEMTNKEASKALFKIIPMITYRDLFVMKTSSLLRFNQRKEDDGFVINLSVTNQDNIIMKTKDMEYTQEPQNLTNVKHEYIDEDAIKQIYIEDLVLPGYFETTILPNSSKTIRLYISCQNFNICDLGQVDVFSEYEQERKELTDTIAEEFVELRELAYSIQNLTIDRCLVPSLPYAKDYTLIYYNPSKLENTKGIIKDIHDFTDVIKSIDGQYLTFNKIKEANKVLVKIRRYIKTLNEIKVEDIAVEKEFMLLKLWYVESVNRILQKNNDIDLYLDFVREIVYSLISSPNKEELCKNIEIVSLAFNAIKIYENMLAENKQEDVKLYENEEYLKKLIEEEFWLEDKRIMKRNLDDEIYCANIQMIYTLSLSYPCIVNDMPIKLLDTIFKELYTPYGLREISKNSSQNTGLIFPKYMAHFVKANLRQNGVTRASQKIAYNLVKELMQDINKNVNGGIKKVYHEKGINVDSIGYDLLTNAEVIRLYNMLT